MAVNYQLELERELQKNEGKTPRLLLHCCCAPCSSYVLEYLSPHFSITAHYYNPNIDTPEEYAHRARELSRFVQEMPLPGAVDVLAEPYTPAEFYAAVKGLEDIPEGGRRCYECYRLRLRRAAQAAAAGGYDYFTTTLSISPHKNAVWLGELGEAFAAEYGVRCLRISKRKTASSAAPSWPPGTACTGRITAGACSPGARPRPARRAKARRINMALKRARRH